MAGIVATLKTDDGRCFFSQQVNNFTLTFVTPLGAQNNNAFAHGRIFHSVVKFKNSGADQYPLAIVLLQSLRRPCNITIRFGHYTVSFGP